MQHALGQEESCVRTVLSEEDTPKQATPYGNGNHHWLTTDRLQLPSHRDAETSSVPPFFQIIIINGRLGDFFIYKRDHPSAQKF